MLPIKFIKSLQTLIVILLFWGHSLVQAAPPAPYYTLYGTVRDQVGKVVTVDDEAEVTLLKGSTVITSVQVIPQLDQNYEMEVRIDALRPGTKAYTVNSVAAAGEFHLLVKMKGVSYYPIEASGPLTAGQGAERIRLDLTLGEDSDGDGLPDIWEHDQLSHGGYSPDANGLWPIHLIDRTGDFDHDGLNNFDEYLAGTYASDAGETFGLEIKESVPTGVRFEFFAVTNKTYSIERSANLKDWVPVTFAIGTPGTGALVFTAPSPGIVSAFSDRSGNLTDHYRLVLR